MAALNEHVDERTKFLMCALEKAAFRFESRENLQMTFFRTMDFSTVNVKQAIKDEIKRARRYKSFPYTAIMGVSLFDLSRTSLCPTRYPRAVTVLFGALSMLGVGDENLLDDFCSVIDEGYDSLNDKVIASLIQKYFDVKKVVAECPRALSWMLYYITNNRYPPTVLLVLQLLRKLNNGSTPVIEAIIGLIQNAGSVCVKLEAFRLLKDLKIVNEKDLESIARITREFLESLVPPAGYLQAFISNVSYGLGFFYKYTVFHDYCDHCFKMYPDDGKDRNYEALFEWKKNKLPILMEILRDTANGLLAKVESPDGHLDFQDTRDFSFNTIVEKLRTNDLLDEKVRLSLDAGYISLWQTEDLCEALTTNTTVTDLSLEDIQIGSRGAEMLSTVLQGNRTLRTLDLSSTHLTDQKKDVLDYATVIAFKALSTVLLTNPTLIKLVLTGNTLGNDGAKWLGTALEKNNTLTDLHLDRNVIRDSGAMHLAGALLLNTGLINLVLNHNFIGVMGVTALITALESNTTLRALNLAFNNCSVDARDDFQSARESSLARLNRSQCRILF